jgi:hypothetical protein
MAVINKLKAGFKRFLRDDRALVVSWFDCVKLLFFVMLLFVSIGIFMDETYEIAYNAPEGLYTAEDLDTIGTLYDLYKYIPMLALVIILIYAINYANNKGSD